MMGPGETIAFVALMGAVIGGLIFMGGMIKHYLAYRERRLQLLSGDRADRASDYAAQVAKLEARMRVLERIATDKGVQLADEIEDLRDPQAN